MAINGRRTFVPVSDDTTVLEFIPPNKMRVLIVTDELTHKILQSMTWEERGSKYYGHGIFREGALIFSVSEVLTDT